ncbi:ABC transporter permease [bacterium]|nr:ABC transporter permease [bacterium]
MKDRLLLALYLAAVVAATLVHAPALLGAGLLLVLALAGRGAPRLLGRVLLAVGPFLLVLNLSLLALPPAGGGSRAATLLRTDLRVLLIASLSLLVAQRVNLFRALAPWRGLSALLVLAAGQIQIGRRLLADARLALASRSLERPGLALLYRHAGAMGIALIRRSEAASAELAQALRSRGWDHD